MRTEKQPSCHRPSTVARRTSNHEQKRYIERHLAKDFAIHQHRRVQLPAKKRTVDPRTDVSFTLNARGHYLTVKDRSETINIYLIYCKAVIYKIITFSNLCKAHTVLIVLSYDIYFSIFRIASNK